MRRSGVAEPSGGLSIGQLADWTGVPAATLRTWESRYGFPEPQRQPGRHRRYLERDVGLVADVLRHRAAGLSLEAAIRQTAADGSAAEGSIFASLRRRHPGLAVQVLRKTTLLALTRAMEDECGARAEQPVIFASFQRGRYYHRSQPRWAELARTARLVVVLADFTGRPDPLPPWPDGLGPAGAPQPAEPVLVPVPAGSPLAREWALICESPGFPACITGWEQLDHQGAGEAGRRFEVSWTLDPRIVRDAAVIAASLTAALVPDLSWLPGALPAIPPPPPSADLQSATGLLTRMTAYLETAGRGALR
jgi:DICT domain-containing protein